MGSALRREKPIKTEMSQVSVGKLKRKKARAVEGLLYRPKT